MNGFLDQSGIRKRTTLPAITFASLLVLVAASVAAATSAAWPAAPSAMVQRDITALPGHGGAVLSTIPADVALPGPRGESLQAGKVWDLVNVQLEVFEGNTKVLTRTLGSGPVGMSHAYSANLWEFSQWFVTGTARLNASARAAPPATLREGEAAVFPLSGVFGVAIQDAERTSWGDYRHSADLTWLGSYSYCGRYSYGEHTYMTSPSDSISIQANCYITPTVNIADRFDLAFMGVTRLSWRAKSGPTLHFVARYSYQLRASTGTAVSLEGRAIIDPNEAIARLIGVPVTLLRGDKVLAQTVTQGPEGRYFMPQVPITNNLVLSVTLEHAAMSPPTFRILYSQTTPIVLPYVATRPFTISGAANSVVKDILFMEGPDITASSVISPSRLDDLSSIYFHAQQAWKLTDQLNQPLDNRLPLDIYAYSTVARTYWNGPFSTGAESDVDPFINIQASFSDFLNNNRPDNREWHEFGHAVMADMYDNLMPWSPNPCNSPPQTGDDCNHGGYANASSTDSWVEGFAEFFSLMVARDIRHEERPDLYRSHGHQYSLEANYLTWTGKVAGNPAASRKRNVEEYAVASLLWDLVDPADADDATTFAPGGVTYADCVATDLERLWGIISRPWGGTVVGSPVAPPTYTYIFDVKHLYDVLKHEGIGSAKSRGRALDDLDELFIAHGFFKDANGNRVYDAGEAVGWSGHGALPGVPARLGRRSSPPITGSYIAYQARVKQTGASVPVQSVSVDVRFPPPLEHLNYAYRQTVDTPGLIYFVAHDQQYGAVTYIRAWAPGLVSTSPLTVTSATYWERMAAEPTHHFIDHTFEMTRTVTVRLPLILSGYGATASSVDPGGATVAAAASARTPRACVP